MSQNTLSTVSNFNFVDKTVGWQMGIFVLVLLVFIFFYDTCIFKLVLGIIALHASLGNTMINSLQKQEVIYLKRDQK